MHENETWESCLFVFFLPRAFLCFLPKTPPFCFLNVDRNTGLSNWYLLAFYTEWAKRQLLVNTSLILAIV